MPAVRAEQSEQRSQQPEEITLYNVCSVHQGTGSVHRGVFSTSEGYHEYIGGCSVHWGMFSTSEGYHEYIGGIS